MTYCVAMRLNSGLVFLSDSRTNAGVDQVGSFRKMSVFENPGDRMMVLLTAGNLSISQSIRQIISDHVNAAGKSIWTVNSMYEAAQIIGDAIRTVHLRDAAALANFGIDFNVSMIFGGQVGEAKYGKPILDRVVTPDTTLDEAAKCALISMDSTLRSNISVGLPLDLLLYEAGSFAVNRFVTIDERNQYFQMIRTTWGQQLKSIFEDIADPVWDAAPEATANVLSATNMHSKPVRVPLPPALAARNVAPALLQSVAQHDIADTQP
ncbi:MAG: peptidase [Pseudomonadota bacterium]